MYHSTPQDPAPAPETEVREMILLTLIRSEENKHSLDPGDLASELALARPALDAHLRTLQEQHLLLVEPLGKISLTPAGRVKAFSLLRRHRLSERLFTDVLGLDWTRAHQEADKFEHTITPEAEEQLASQLGDPETCPHGNRIPGAATRTSPASVSSVPLAECIPLNHGRIDRIALETPASLQHLATLGLLPGTEIEVENKAPLGGPVLVRVGRAHYALGRDLAARIWVQVES